MLNAVKERPLLWKETHFTGTLWTHRFAVWQIAWHGIEFKRGHQYLVCKKYYNFLLFKAAKEELSKSPFLPCQCVKINSNFKLYCMLENLNTSHQYLVCKAVKEELSLKVIFFAVSVRRINPDFKICPAFLLVAIHIWINFDALIKFIYFKKALYDGIYNFYLTLLGMFKVAFSEYIDFTAKTMTFKLGFSLTGRT